MNTSKLGKYLLALILIYQWCIIFDSSNLYHNGKIAIALLSSITKIDRRRFNYEAVCIHTTLNFGNLFPYMKQNNVSNFHAFCCKKCFDMSYSRNPFKHIPLF